MVSMINSLGLMGVEAFRVLVEADMHKGVPGIEVVGLPDAVVKEARERVRSAVRSTGFELPNLRMVINLAPAGVKKYGSIYDLPMFVAVLCTAGSLRDTFRQDAFIGELTFGGQVKPVNGILPMAESARRNGFKRFFVPAENAREAAICDGIDIIPVSDTLQLVGYLRGKEKPVIQPHETFSAQELSYPVDFSDVKGQLMVRHVMEIAACGGHNILLLGSPGAGKSMMAKRLPTIMPDLTIDEMIEITRIHSVAGTLEPNSGLLTRRPFRSPHHTVSTAGLTGGGTIPRPGEISLSHHGVLFLDELPEFDRNTIETLRQPMEDGIVTISRANASVRFPSSFLLVAAMNPCPCGYYGHPTHPCICSPKVVSRYLSHISGPLLDRIDLQIEVPPVDYSSLSDDEKGECSAEMKKRVDRVRKLQQERFRGTNISCNARILPSFFPQFCPLDDEAKSRIKKIFDVMGYSARSYSRVITISRTIADMDDSEVIRSRHIMEAVQYRNLDRKYWLR